MTRTQLISDILLRVGNPNHKSSGPGGGQFTSGPGGSGNNSHGKHWAKRQRKRARQSRKKIERFRNAAKRTTAQQKQRHREERQKATSKHREDWHKLKSEHGQQRRELKRDQHKESREFAKERQEHHRADVKDSLKAQTKERRKLDEASRNDERKHAQAMDKAIAAKDRQAYDAAESAASASRERHSKAYEEADARHEKHRAELKEKHQKIYNNLKEEMDSRHADERGQLHADQKQERRDKKAEINAHRQDIKDAHKAENRKLIDRLKGVARERFPRRKSDAASRSVAPSRYGDDGASLVARRFSGRRLSSATRAEAILSVCLRSRGWTGKHKRDALTGKQRLTLLDDIRDYGKSWLHHEAEELFRGFQHRAMPNSDGHAMAHVDRGLLSGAKEAVSRFFSRAKNFVHEIILAGTLALGGPGNPTAEELQKVSKEVEEQWRYFDRFHREVLNNPPKELVDPSTFTVDVLPAPMTSREFAARAESYGNSVWIAANNVGRATAAQGWAKMERRVHFKPPGHHECQTCIQQTSLGWQPVGTLREIGDSECMGNCDCYFEWDDGAGRIYIAPHGRHNPKGFYVEDDSGRKRYKPTRPKGGGQPTIPELPGTSGPKEKKPAPPKGEPPRPEGEPDRKEFFEKLGLNPEDYEVA